MVDTKLIKTKDLLKNINIIIIIPYMSFSSETSHSLNVTYTGDDDDDNNNELLMSSV